MITLLPDSVTQNERRSSLFSIIFNINTPYCVTYKAANIKEVQFRLKFCVVAHRYIPGCCCSSFWEGMSAVLGAWVLVNMQLGLRIDHP